MIKVDYSNRDDEKYPLVISLSAIDSDENNIYFTSQVDDALNSEVFAIPYKIKNGISEIYIENIKKCKLVLSD